MIIVVFFNFTEIEFLCKPFLRLFLCMMFFDIVSVKNALVLMFLIWNMEHCNQKLEGNPFEIILIHQKSKSPSKGTIKYSNFKYIRIPFII